MAARPYDQTRWRRSRALISGTPSTPGEVTLAYIDCRPDSKQKGTILLLHGFPQTSYQFRHAITPISDAGYRVVAPDYRGAGDSSHPRGLGGFSKVSLATDLHKLMVDHLKVNEPYHVVGHDIGAMVAHAHATTFPDATRTVLWGEAAMPGTSSFAAGRHDPFVWHFDFHAQPDLPEALVAGNVRMYLEHFFTRHSSDNGAIADADLDHYVRKYEQAGALRCAFDLYRNFPSDSEHNQGELKRVGKSKVPALALAGGASAWLAATEDMVREFYETVDVASVDDAGHYCAEENPEGFVEAVLGYIAKHG